MFFKTASLSVAVAMVLFAAGGAMAEEAMSSGAMGAGGMSAGNMAPEAMGPMMSEKDLQTCIEQAKAITFPEVAMVAEQACHALGEGKNAMGGGAMGNGAMAPKQ
ncbi:hypothetical protein [Devosia sp.]|uniref:hypothetical protein n=1 Tax=Devosia sp. TaxID=1871048 RepID=UPI001AC5ED35|nr:hypothetical protein [Devosia sp.]MBN9332897.1 hypothetical protein [Devosia sp.]